MTLFSSLTNRIFVASALLAVVSIAVAIYNVNVAVTAQAEQELRRGVEEAGAFVGEYRRLLFDHFSREARLIADLPKLKAAVHEEHSPTVQPIGKEYQQQLEADFILITSAGGRELARVSSQDTPGHAFDPALAAPTAAAGREATSFWHIAAASCRSSPCRSGSIRRSRRFSARSASGSASTTARPRGSPP